MRVSVRGFSLIELTIGTTVFTVVMAAAFFLLIRYGQVSAKGDAIATTLNLGRTAAMTLNNDVRNARYVYHFSAITIDPGIKVDGLDVVTGMPAAPPASPPNPSGTAQFRYPLVTSGAPIPALTTLPGGSPSGGFLATDSIALLRGAVDKPRYVLWFRHRGPADYEFPTTAEDTYRPLWNKLIRLEMDCDFEPNAQQGRWLDMARKWGNAQFDTLSPLRFYAVKSVAATTAVCTPSAGITNCECLTTKSRGFGRVLNDNVFEWESPHPYSREGPVSPYWITINLRSADPLNNYLRTGAKGGGGIPVPGTTNWFVDAVRLQSQAFVRNVTLPGAK